MRWLSGVFALGVCLSGCATLDQGETWKATRTSDPITGVSRCVVAAYDRSGGFSFSRTGYLYPIVEANSQYGLLVGVSSGGTYRAPSGAVVWRVDQRPYRQLSPMNNPQLSASSGAENSDPIANAQRMVQAATQTSTLASGETAQAMLAEMKSGAELIFRSETISATYGLPDAQALALGQLTSSGEIKPYPLDASFHRALSECGIT